MSTELQDPPVANNGKEIIHSLQERVSASRLSLFLSCRLKFFFKYVDGIVKPKTPALHVGSSVHAALKAWNKARWRNQPLTLRQLHDEFSNAWADESEGAVDWDEDQDAAKATGWRLIETYVRQTNIETRPDAVEVSVEADLHQQGLPILIGILDLVQTGRIVDYKTSSQTPNPEKVIHTTEVQTSVYAVLYRETTGMQEAGIELHHLVKLKNPKLVITAVPPMSEQQQTRLFRIMEAYIDGLERRDFIPSPGLQCSSCEYFNECRRWS